MVQKKRALHDYYEEFLGNRLGVRLQSTAPGYYFSIQVVVFYWKF